MSKILWITSDLKYVLQEVFSSDKNTPRTLTAGTVQQHSVKETVEPLIYLLLNKSSSKTATNYFFLSKIGQILPISHVSKTLS